jgi:hypothetical protein
MLDKKELEELDNPCHLKGVEEKVLRRMVQNFGCFQVSSC